MTGKRTEDRTIPTLASYFQQVNTAAALDAYRRFVTMHRWPVTDKVHLYWLCGEAFNPNLASDQQHQRFEIVYSELRKHWQIFRGAESYWSASQVQHALTMLPIECSQGGVLLLPGITPTSHAETLLECITMMEGVKTLPTHRTPIMAISKFLHLYNPRLFPIFDNAVIIQSVLPTFSTEWQSFPTPILKQTASADALSYLKYLFWAASLIQEHEKAISSIFVEWLTAQLIHEGATETPPVESREWYATAFECIAIGAMHLQEHPLTSSGNISAGRMRPFTRGTDFPHEGFVQQAIERYFADNGFTTITGDTTDLICTHPTRQERWEIEAKGMTTAVGLDFRTGLGQLIQRMTSSATCHALAVPDIPQFRRQCRQLQPWVRLALNLFWLLVQEDGTVLVVPPNDDM